LTNDELVKKTTRLLSPISFSGQSCKSFSRVMYASANKLER